MKVRLIADRPHPAAEARLWQYMPHPGLPKKPDETLPPQVMAAGQVFEVPDELGEWLLRRFPADFELAVVEQAPAPTRNKQAKDPGVQK